ncbi:MAG: cysteine--tRNA ligase [Candidatus Aenigmatarchaeota archaeon]
MATRFFNTLTRKIQPFRPMHDKKVSIYTCGPTVYYYAHIGNLRSYIFADLLRRFLEFSGFTVKAIVNFTDVGHLVSDADTGDDKMEVGAKREHKTAWKIADFYIDVFKSDVGKLHIKPPSIWCRATEHINEMIELIKKLEKKGFTYHTDDGIYFDTSKLNNYGELAGLKKAQIKPGARVEIVSGKRNPTDFALWKFSPPDKKRQMEWQSPWGIGFPGWHIECSAMSMKYLGKTFDIHTGGIDHINIHHPNEIAQSEAATGKKFVNYWLHNEFMNVNGEKIAKSLGNFYTLSDLAKKGFSPLAFRYLCMSSHYRSPINFSFESLKKAEQTVQNINEFVRCVKDLMYTTKAKTNKKLISLICTHRKKIVGFLSDDLNTPQALAEMHDMMKLVNKCINDNKADKKFLKEAYSLMLDMNKMFDFLLEEGKLTVKEKNLIEKRENARKQKNYNKSDEIRLRLKEMGIILEDTPRGVRWKKARKNEKP